MFGLSFFPGAEAITNLLARVVLDLFFTTIVVRFVYFKLYQHRDNIFTYFLLNVVTFSLAFLLSNVALELGLGLGLFAVFGILRYRTTAIQVRDLTYLFVVIGIGLVNALANGDISWIEVLLINGLIVGSVCLLEVGSFSGREESRRVLYDRPDLVGPETARELLEDLRSRTHLPVSRYEIGNMDLLKDAVEVVVYYPVSGRRAAFNPADEESTTGLKNTSA